MTQLPRESLRADANPPFKWAEKPKGEVLGASAEHKKPNSQLGPQKGNLQGQGKITAHDFKLENTTHPPSKKLQEIGGDDADGMKEPLSGEVRLKDSARSKELNQAQGDLKHEQVGSNSKKSEYTIEELLKMEFNTDEEPTEDQRMKKNSKKDLLKSHQRPNPEKIMELEKEEESVIEESRKTGFNVHFPKPTSQPGASNRIGPKIQENPVMQGPSKLGAKPESRRPGLNEADQLPQQSQKDSVTKKEIMPSKKAESAEIKSAREMISTLRNIFEGLSALYEHCKTESSDFEQTSPLYYEELATLHQLFKEKIQEFAANPTQENEQILSEMLGLDEKIFGLKTNFKKYQSKKAGFEEHRIIALQLITPTEREEIKNTDEALKTPKATSEDQNQKSEIKGLPSNSIKSNDLRGMKTGGAGSVKNLKPGQTHHEENIEGQWIPEEGDHVTNLPRDSVNKDAAPSFKFQGKTDGNKTPVGENKGKVSTLQGSNKEPSQKDQVDQNERDKVKVEMTEGLFFRDNAGDLIQKKKLELEEKKLEIGEKKHQSLDRKEENKMELDTRGKEFGIKFGSHYEEITHEPKRPESNLELLSKEPNKEPLNSDQRINQQKSEGQMLQMSQAPKTMAEKNRSISKPVVKAESPLPQKEIKSDFITSGITTGAPQRGSKRPQIWDDPIENKVGLNLETPVGDNRLVKARNLIPKLVSTKASGLHEDGEQQLQDHEISSQKSHPIKSSHMIVQHKNSHKMLASQQIIHASDLLDDFDEQAAEKEENLFYAIQEEPEEQRVQNDEELIQGQFNLKSSTSPLNKNLQQETTISMHNNRKHNENHKMLQSLNPRVVASKQQPEDAGRVAKSMTQSEKSINRRSPLNLANEIKWIGKSIKLSRDRSADFKASKLKHGAFSGQNTSKSDFFQKYLSDSHVLNQFEEELHLIKRENETLRNSIVGDSGDQLKLTVNNLQKQLVDYQREYEQLKNQNSALETRPRESVDESLILKLKQIEAENLNLKTKLDRVNKDKKLRTEPKTLQETAKELEDENDELANLLNNLTRDQFSMTRMLSDLDEPQRSSNGHIDPDDSRRIKEKPRGSHGSTSSKTELTSHKIATGGSSSPQVFHKSQTPKGKNDFDWFVNTPSQLHYDASLKNNTIHYGSVEQGKYYSRNYRQTAKNEMHRSERENGRQGVGEDQRYFPKNGSNLSSPASSKVESGRMVSNGNPKSNAVFTYQIDHQAADRNHQAKYEHSSSNRSRGYDEASYSSGKLADSYSQFSPQSFTRNIETAITPNRKVPIYDSNGEIKVKRDTEYNFDWDQRNLNSEKGHQHNKKPAGQVSYDVIQKPSLISGVEEELQARLLSKMPSNAPSYFKLSCLNPKSLIYENEFVRVGLSSVFVQSQLKIILFFDNKTDEPISDFTTNVSQDVNLHVTMKPEAIDSVVVRGRQAKQMILVSLKRVPISCLEVHCEGLWGTQRIKFGFSLPTMINKFMESKYSDHKEFHEFWKRHSRNVLLKSETIFVDESVVSDVSDFKKYFANLIELKPEFGEDLENERKDIKLGAIFELKELGSEYALKIHFSNTYQATFELATSLINIESAEFILQNFVFLFKQ